MSEKGPRRSVGGRTPEEMAALTEALKKKAEEAAPRFRRIVRHLSTNNPLTPSDPPATPAVRPPIPAKPEPVAFVPTPDQLAVLKCLAAKNMVCTQADIEAATGISRKTVGKLLKELDAVGMVKKGKKGSAVTPAGKAAATSYPQLTHK